MSTVPKQKHLKRVALILVVANPDKIDSLVAAFKDQRKLSRPIPSKGINFAQGHYSYSNLEALQIFDACQPRNNLQRESMLPHFAGKNIMDDLIKYDHELVAKTTFFSNT
ncbi:hypothetical protein WAI453_007459 [Rhynchosporium graminicola]